MDAENLPERTTPWFSLLQRESFIDGVEGRLNLNTDPDKLEQQAKEKLSQGGWLYVASNAGLSKTHKANREAFDRWRIVPRMLVDTNKRDLSTDLFGKRVNAPIGLAPIGLNIIYDPYGELGPAKIAGELGIPYALSTAGSKSLEDVGAANGPEGLRYFQLYAPHDDELLISLLERAHKSGFDACLFTLDTWQLAWRHDDVAAGNYAPYHGKSLEFGLADPVFRKRLSARGIVPGRSKEDDERTGQLWIDNVWHGKAHTWEKTKWIMAEWKRISGGKPFLLKGIQSARDAVRAAEEGCDGVVVSNHAGRQVDGAIASLDALVNIRKAVKPKYPDFKLFFDSGVRSAADVFKALALGADCVCVGRLYIWALSVGGEAGVRRVMRALLAEFDILMNCAGFRSIKEIQEAGDAVVYQADSNIS